VITGLFAMAIVIPALLWLTWHRNADDTGNSDHLSFRDWAAGEFETWTGSVKGANASVEILLPIAAVAVGMMMLGLVFPHHPDRRRLMLLSPADEVIK